MKLRILSLALVFLLLFTAIPAYAGTTEQNHVIYFEDGSYVEISITQLETRATNTKNGYKTYTFYDASDNIEWKAKLSATFTYTGSTSTCTSANCTVTIYESKWYEISNSTTRSGATATTHLTMGKRFLGITTSKPEYTITLTCDKNGNLS